MPNKKDAIAKSRAKVMALRAKVKAKRSKYAITPQLAVWKDTQPKVTRTPMVAMLPTVKAYKSARVILPYGKVNKNNDVWLSPNSPPSGKRPATSKQLRLLRKLYGKAEFEDSFNPKKLTRDNANKLIKGFNANAIIKAKAKIEIDTAERYA